MKTIGSRDNPAYKHLGVLLRDARKRREAGHTVLEGIHLCRTYLDQVGQPRQLWWTQTALEHREAAALIKQIDCDSFCIPENLFAAISTLEHGTGLLCLIDIPVARMPDRVEQSCLLLDRIQDPGNLGTLMRTAAAAGHTAIFCGPGCADAWSPKVLRAAMGAHFFLNAHEEFEWDALLSSMAIPLLATDLNAQQELYQLDLRAPAAWLFGNEGAGLDAGLLKSATTRLRIPQPGRIESLNVAAAAAICLFEQVRQQKQEG